MKLKEVLSEANKPTKTFDEVKAELIKKVQAGQPVDVAKALEDAGCKVVSTEELFGPKMDEKTLIAIAKGMIGQEVEVEAPHSLHIFEFTGNQGETYEEKLEIVETGVTGKIVKFIPNYESDNEDGPAIEMKLTERAMVEYYDADEDQDVQDHVTGGIIYLSQIHSIELKNLPKGRLN